MGHMCMYEQSRRGMSDSRNGYSLVKANAGCIRYPSKTAKGTSLQLIRVNHHGETPSLVIWMQRAQSLRWKRLSPEVKVIESRCYEVNKG